MLFHGTSDTWAVPPASFRAFPAPSSSASKPGPVTESAEGAAEKLADLAVSASGEAKADDPEAAAKAAAKKAKKAAEAAAKKAKLEAKKAKLAEMEAAKKAKEASGDAKPKKKKGGEKEADPEDVAALAAARAVKLGDYKDPNVVPMAKTYDPKNVETAWYEWWEKDGFFKPEMGSDKPKFVIVIPPPQRHRRAAHRPRVDQLHPGHHRALAPDVRLRGALGARHGPRRHRHADRRGEEAAARGGHLEARPRAREVPRARLRVEGAFFCHSRISRETRKFFPRREDDGAFFFSERGDVHRIARDEKLARDKKLARVGR